MNAEDEIDRRTLDYSDMVRVLVAAGKIRAAFINYIDSELLVVIKEGFDPKSLDSARERLPIWLQGINFPKDQSIVYSTSCTKICSIRTIEIEGSPDRLRLMCPELERIL